MTSLSMMSSPGVVQTEYQPLQKVAEEVCIEANREQAMGDKMNSLFARCGCCLNSSTELQGLKEDSFSLDIPQLIRQVGFEKQFNPIGKIVVT